MRLWKNKELVGSKIIRLGPICIKHYMVHKRLPDIPAVTRLRREVIGANLLSSRHVTIARPWVWSERGAWVIRRWYPGVHPDKQHRPTKSNALRFCKLAIRTPWPRWLCSIPNQC